VSFWLYPAINTPQQPACHHILFAFVHSYVDTRYHDVLLDLPYLSVAGYLVMLGSPVASNPYAIMCFMSLFTFVAALAALSAFKYAVFLMLVTAYSLILCQYTPNVPGFHGTVHIFYDRLVDIAIGVLVVLLLDLILPW